MPHDNPRNDSSRHESARAERTRNERASSVAAGTPYGEIGIRSAESGLRMQNEMAEIFQEIGSEWFSRATSKAELALKLPDKLSNTHSLPDAFAAYHEWLAEWMSLVGEDTHHLLADSRKIMDAGLRCFAGARSPAAAG